MAVAVPEWRVSAGPCLEARGRLPVRARPPHTVPDGLNQPRVAKGRCYVLPIPPTQESPYTFHLLQQWEGTVTELGEGEFTAELRDLTDPTNYREEAVFGLDDVSPDDRSLFALGAVFRWSIGYRTSTAGQR